MKTLEEELPATTLLKIYESPKTSANKAIIERALLNYTTTNKQYRREVAQVWAAHVSGPIAVYETCPKHRLTDANLAYAANILRTTGNIDAAIGDVLTELGTRKLLALQWEILPTPPDEVATRLQNLVQHCATDCTYDKFGDKYLWNMLQFVIPASAAASLCDETPYKAVAAVHGDRTNELVQGWIRTLPQDLPGRIDYSSDSPEGLTVIAGVLQEHLDNTEMHVAVNGAELYDDAGSTLVGLSGLVDVPDTVACRSGDILYMAAPQHAYTSVVLKWAEATKRQELVLALTDPASLPPTSTLKQYC